MTPDTPRPLPIRELIGFPVIAAVILLLLVMA